MQSSVLEEMNFVQEHNSLILRKAKEITVRLQLSMQSAKLTKNQQLRTRQDTCDEKTTSSMLYINSATNLKHGWDLGMKKITISLEWHSIELRHKMKKLTNPS